MESIINSINNEGINKMTNEKEIVPKSPPLSLTDNDKRQEAFMKIFDKDLDGSTTKDCEEIVEELQEAFPVLMHLIEHGGSFNALSCKKCPGASKAIGEDGNIIIHSLKKGTDFNCSILDKDIKKNSSKKYNCSIVTFIDVANKELADFYNSTNTVKVTRVDLLELAPAILNIFHQYVTNCNECPYFGSNGDCYMKNVALTSDKKVCLRHDWSMQAVMELAIFYNKNQR